MTPKADRRDRRDSRESHELKKFYSYLCWVRTKSKVELGCNPARLMQNLNHKRFHNYWRVASIREERPRDMSLLWFVARIAGGRRSAFAGEPSVVQTKYPGWGLHHEGGTSTVIARAHSILSPAYPHEENAGVGWRL